MKKTYSMYVMVMLAAALAFGLMFVGCDDGNDKEDPPTSYTVTFKNGDKTLPVKAAVDSALAAAWPTDEALEGVFGEILSDAAYKVSEGWFDQDGKRFLSDTLVTKDLTVQHKWLEIPAADTLKVGESNASAGTPLVVELTLSHVNTTPEERAGAYKFFRIGSDVPANHILQIDAEYTVTLKEGGDAIDPHFIGFQASIDRYGWGLSWDQRSPISQKIQKKVDQGKTALIDNAIKLLVDQAEDVASIGDVIVVTFTKLNVTDIGEPLTVTFKAAGGVGEDAVIEVFAGSSLSIFSLPSFTKDSKVLKGWSLSDSGAQVDPLAAAIDANVVYFALWADEEFTTYLGTKGATIDISSWDDFDYVEAIFEGPSSPGTSWGIGAWCDGNWTGIININTPSTALVPDGGVVTFTERRTVSQLKALIGDAILINEWTTFSTVIINHISYVEPEESKEFDVPLGGLTVKNANPFPGQYNGFTVDLSGAYPQDFDIADYTKLTVTAKFSTSEGEVDANWGYGAVRLLADPTGGTYQDPNVLLEKNNLGMSETIGMDISELTSNIGGLYLQNNDATILYIELTGVRFYN